MILQPARPGPAAEWDTRREPRLRSPAALGAALRTAAVSCDCKSSLTRNTACGLRHPENNVRRTDRDEAVACGRTNTGGLTMNNDRVAGVWHQVKGKVKEKWGKLTDDDLRELEGHGEQLAGKLQERYGLARDEAEREAKEFRKAHNWH